MQSKRIAVLVALSLVAVFSFISLPAHSQDKKPDAPAGAAGGAQDMAEMQKAWAAYMTPGPEHQQLQKHFEGTWNTEVKSFMGAPEVTTGTTVNKMIMGGRYLTGTYDGTMNGQPFQGAGLTGFDNAKKKYFGTWIDSFGTGMMVTEGAYDPDTQTYTFTGEMTMPDGSASEVREILNVINNNKHTFEMYMSGPEGKEMKAMEITYTRKQ